MAENRQLETERKLIYFLPALVIVMLFATLLIRSQVDTRDEVDSAQFHQLTNQFLVHLNMVRTQWNIHGRPIQTEVNGVSVTMGVLGIPDLRTPHGSYNCKALWRLMLDKPMALNDRPITALAMQDQRLEGEYCRYLLTENVYFDVDLRHGTLSQRAEKLRAIQQNGD